MTAIKSLDKCATKLVQNAQAASQSYTEGTQNPRRPWAASAKAAEDSYKQGVTAAAAKGSFGKGVAAAGDDAHKRGCAEKGSVRFGPGVAVASNAYQAGFSKYHTVISNLTLPPRRARRDPANLQRVTAVATALGQAKEASTK